ncbi:hypothetical protein [Streptomyces sp. MI02-7b]|uniref:hypothetical protein n=1 Tax=Streptomyces sp. MI02-7b TaxID=462941 RepID=UPI0029BB3622|nr:hypothetical protein [Streptomyces sp. MI02-7b]MDX3078273.1 hypothetical protein [Streptomyces sp. MI02-7b]
MHHERDPGAGRSRGTDAERATGEPLFLLDGDDTLPRVADGGRTAAAPGRRP